MVSKRLDRRPLFSAGQCPVCADAGELLVLRRLDLEVFFYFCTSCGNAFKKKPDPPTDLNEINRLRDVAPHGIAIPEKSELSAMPGLTPVADTEFEDLVWHCEREFQS